MSAAMKIVQDAGAASRARSKFPDRIWCSLTNLLVIRFTQSCMANTQRGRGKSPFHETLTLTVLSTNRQKNMANKTTIKGILVHKELLNEMTRTHQNLTEIVSSFLHCWDKSRMPLTKSLLALTYVFPASIIPLHSFTSCGAETPHTSCLR